MSSGSKIPARPWEADSWLLLIPPVPSARLFLSWAVLSLSQLPSGRDSLSRVPSPFPSRVAAVAVEGQAAAEGIAAAADNFSTDAKLSIHLGLLPSIVLLAIVPSNRGAGQGKTEIVLAFRSDAKLKWYYR